MRNEASLGWPGGGGGCGMASIEPPPEMGARGACTATGAIEVTPTSNEDICSSIAGILFGYSWSDFGDNVAENKR